MTTAPRPAPAVKVIRQCPHTGEWIAGDGSRWRRLDPEYDALAATIRDVYRKIDDGAEDTGERFSVPD